MRASPCFALLALALAARVLGSPVLEKRHGGADLDVACDKAVVAPGILVAPARIEIRDGAIAAVRQVDPAEGELQAAPGIPLLDARRLVAAPGFVDVRSGCGLAPWSANEEGAEITPTIHALDLVDPASPDFVHALRAGTTTVVLSPGGRASIGGFAGAVKTDGRPLSDRTLARELALTVTLGNEPWLGNRLARFQQPSGLYFRRPGTRMGNVSGIRRAFLAARQHADGVAAGGPAGAEVLRRALAGELPILMRAPTESDIRTAIRLGGELGVTPVLVNPVEGHRLVEAVAASKSPVVLGPFYQEPRQMLEWFEGEDIRHANAKLLDDGGVTVAIGSGPDDAPESLLDNARLAVRHGLDRTAALAAVTRAAARMLGLGDRVGSLERGADGDVVILDGDPLSPETRVLAVVIEGRVEHRDPQVPLLPAAPAAASSGRNP